MEDEYCLACCIENNELCLNENYPVRICHRHHREILEGTFIETTLNLTLLIILGYKYCPDSKEFKLQK